MLNVQGLVLDKFNNNLVPSLLPRKYDCICLCETWLKATDNLNYQLPDYYCINKPSKHLNKQARRGSGGVLLYIHKSLNIHVKLQEPSNSEDRIRESVDSLCRDGADTPIVRVHRKAFLTRERSRSKPVWAPSYSSPAFLYPTIPAR